MEGVCLTLDRQHSDVLLCKGSQPFHDRATGESLEVPHCQTNLLDDIREMLAPLPLEQAVLADCPSNSQDPQSCTRLQAAGLCSVMLTASADGNTPQSATENHAGIWGGSDKRHILTVQSIQGTFKLYSTVKLLWDRTQLGKQKGSN